jgi:mono/diheme cytochrome c family protein
MNWPILLAVLAVIAALLFTRINLLSWVAILGVAVYVVVSYAIIPPLPSSIVGMIMAMVIVSLLVYISTDESKLASVRDPLLRFMVDRKYHNYLVAVVVTLPILAAARVYIQMNQPIEPPAVGRTIHPAPPQEMSFKGKKIDLLTVENPYRSLEQSDPQEFAAHVEQGRRVYYENCVFCHVDLLDGDGIFAHGFEPKPASFADPTTIVMLQEGYLFWRIATGGPGLPQESGPGSSSMPAWDQFLSEQEIWEVILFLYDFTEQRPRAGGHSE